MVVQVRTNLLLATLAIATFTTSLGAASPEAVTFSGTATGAYVGFGYVGETQVHEFDLTEPVARIEIALFFEGNALDLDFAVIAPNGVTVERRAAYNDPTGLVPGFSPQEEPIVISDATFTGMTGLWTIEVYPALAYEGPYSGAVTFS